MKLDTRYLGLELPSPLVPGASPLADDLEVASQLEEAGAGAIVMHSLFEEQIELEELGTVYGMRAHEESFAEALSYFPRPSEFRLGPHQYLEHLRRLKQRLSIPVIASLNGTTAAGWIKYATLIEEAGADALELNVYRIPTDFTETSAKVEDNLVQLVSAVRARVRIPLAVKLSPFYSALPALALRLVRAGANGLVLFNRFYQPDFDVDALEVVPHLALSDRGELLLRLRWLAILYGRLKASLAASGGVHMGVDVVKALMAGADVVQVVSALLQFGPAYLARLRSDLVAWLEAAGYNSVDEVRGCLRLESCPDPAAFERANYMRVLQTWRG
jgi:dihydroorotate dehydrogenase (fumarate)